MADVRKLEKALAEKSGSSEAKEVQEKLSKLSQDTTDSLRDLNQKHTSLGVALSGVQAEVMAAAIMTIMMTNMGGKPQETNLQQ